MTPCSLNFWAFFSLHQHSRTFAHKTKNIFCLVLLRIWIHQLIYVNWMAIRWKWIQLTVAIELLSLFQSPPASKRLPIKAEQHPFTFYRKVRQTFECVSAFISHALPIYDNKNRQQNEQNQYSMWTQLWYGSPINGNFMQVYSLIFSAFMHQSVCHIFSIQ